MNMRKTEFSLLLVILIEGYIVLSTELLAIRLSIPFVGSGTDTISIIIAAVLLPLAFGYHRGGQYIPKSDVDGYRGIRGKLASNFLIAQGFLTFGLSYAVLGPIFYGLNQSGLHDRQLMTLIYAAVFLVTPVYLLGQTIPLVAHYFRKKNLSKITGRILFYSTLGSFAGAVFSTLILMSYAGVHYTAAFTLLLLTGLHLAFSKKRFSGSGTLAIALLLIGIAINSEPAMRAQHVVSNNAYNTVAVVEDGDKRFLFTNSSPSSLYTDAKKKFDYIEAFERIALGPIWNSDTPHDILIVGAGGFTIGHEDLSNRYDFVDIDGSLKQIAEERILKEEIPKNHHFHVADVRSYLNSTDKKYDVIILDAYSGRMSLPEHLMTVEFFQQVKEHLKDKGIIGANFAFTPSFASPFSRNLDHTFRSVFPTATTYVVNEHYNLWNDDAENESQMLYFYKNRESEGAPKTYSDIKNSAYTDRPRNR